MNYEKLGAVAYMWASRNPQAVAAAGAAVTAVAADVVLPVAIMATAVAAPLAVAGGVVYGISKMFKGD